MNSAKRLMQLLKDVDSRKGEKFSGLGIILYNDNPNLLPISSLKKVNSQLPITSYESIVNFLIDVSNSNNPYHDGFHLLNKNFELTNISQYIAPPIIKDLKLELEFGSRYRTAVYTSFLNEVIACGVLSGNYAPKVFIKGNSI